MNQAPPGRLVRVSSFSPREADIRFLYSSPDILQNSNFYFVILAPHFLAWFKETCLSKTAPSAQNNTGRFAICQGHSTLFFFAAEYLFQVGLTSRRNSACRFWVARDQSHPGSFSGGRKREDPAMEVAFRLAKCCLTLS